MKKIISRAYNNFYIDETNLEIYKSSKDTKLRDEIFYLSCLPEKIKKFFPTIKADLSSPTEYSMKMEYLADYTDLGKLVISNDNIDWKIILEKIFTILEAFKEYKKERSEMFLYKMLIEKTEREYKNLKTNFPYFEDLTKYDSLVINDASTLNFEKIWEHIIKKIEKFSQSDFNIIHGDFCFPNILAKSDLSDVKLVDPRGSFGEVGIYGDPRYDLAKLSHSVSGGYEFFINDAFTINYDKNKIDFSFTKNDDLKNLFFSYIPEQLFDEIRIIEGLIFIGMCARHYDSKNRQIAMFATGLNILNNYAY